MVCRFLKPDDYKEEYKTWADPEIFRRGCQLPKITWKSNRTTLEPRGGQVTKIFTNFVCTPLRRKGVARGSNWRKCGWLPSWPDENFKKLRLPTHPLGGAHPIKFLIVLYAITIFHPRWPGPVRIVFPFHSQRGGHNKKSVLIKHAKKNRHLLHVYTLQKTIKNRATSHMPPPSNCAPHPLNLKPSSTTEHISRWYHKVEALSTQLYCHPNAWLNRMALQRLPGIVSDIAWTAMHSSWTAPD